MTKNNDMVIDARVGNDTDLFPVNEEHIKYVSNLPHKTRELIALRESLGQGNWDILRAKLPTGRQEELDKLHDYETRHDIDLALYLHLYSSQQKKPS